MRLWVINLKGKKTTTKNLQEHSVTRSKLQNTVKKKRNLSTQLAIFGKFSF